MMKNVTLTVEGPSLEKNAERMARVVAVLEFHADQPGRLMALPPPHVLTSFKLDSRALKLASEPGGYTVEFTTTDGPFTHEGEAIEIRQGVQ